MIVYIAGKMRGLPNYGRENFANAEKKLKDAGLLVLNPATLPIGMEDSKYLPICLAMLDASDAIYLLNNWNDSVGAKVEAAYAKAQGKVIWYEDLASEISLYEK